MKNKILICLVLFGLVVGGQVLAFDVENTGLGKTAETAGYNLTKSDPIVIAGNVIQIFLGLLGLILMIILVYAGFMYMLAGDRSDQVTKAKAWITNSIIGIVIVAGAYAISTYVIEALISSV
ncbi:hypothetical protein A2533_00295 [Candidatus Falkowbacteria bacterium RIFOXYD2_FULL_35_9]|uniref:Uncharacterized protein n=1 Tax=Candidatus Falkowbacteria bacterium RIFOXYC2_FULL_36_12 TaxID=1798002 RepID=A0A1F5T4T8_9BACT|nr:MAG: hypothetical protein A2300_03020 [Candidatus Falkowbacteria bacterium RIFOXYB2_FULL_35_7]OGF33461.1 MAG: hypothetical protein A2478_02090 [Candidatus Falkowbacteria bacterium RIFOXYC2_FULL_36_12]OGF34109.1 MAG: hypothetical protein A2223_01600 [Candidatus Falkowbacteria bacterium RIFOXYA2_FULL_35_8]OGF46019.1 MAG: hypothetical protein A2533_00295 [Candidatus Falkowbacteria bacterium RIFOXYD2_FULL_35_9]